MLTMLPKFELVPMSRYFMTFAEGAPAREDAPVQDVEPLLGQQDVGRLARDVDRVGDGDADVGGVQRGRVVDAVADEPDDVPAAA